MMKAGGTEIGKTLAEKSRGLFSANDWQCKTYGGGRRRQQQRAPGEQTAQLQYEALFRWCKLTRADERRAAVTPVVCVVGTVSVHAGQRLLN